MNTLTRKEQIKEQIGQLVESLEEQGSYSLSFYDDYSQYFTTHYYSCLDDMIDEWADAQVDIYYSELADWIRVGGEAVDYIQEAFEHGLVDGTKQDIYQIIQCAQYLFYRDEIYADFETLEQLHKLHQELADLEREQVA